MRCQRELYHYDIFIISGGDSTQNLLKIYDLCFHYFRKRDATDEAKIDRNIDRHIKTKTPVGGETNGEPDRQTNLNDQLDELLNIIVCQIIELTILTTTVI